MVRDALFKDEPPKLVAETSHRDVQWRFFLGSKAQEIRLPRIPQQR